jgi:hypothetical protein
MWFLRSLAIILLQERDIFLKQSQGWKLWGYLLWQAEGASGFSLSTGRKGLKYDVLLLLIIHASMGSARISGMRMSEQRVDKAWAKEAYSQAHVQKVTAELQCKRVWVNLGLGWLPNPSTTGCLNSETGTFRSNVFKWEGMGTKKCF